MANEITLTIKDRVSNSGYKTDWANGQNSITQTAQGAASGIQAVGTSAENIAGGDVSTPGILFLKNLDGTNFVEFGKDNTGFVAVGKLEAGEEAVFRVADSTTIQLKADTAACDVMYLLLED